MSNHALPLRHPAGAVAALAAAAGLVLAGCGGTNGSAGSSNSSGSAASSAASSSASSSSGGSTSVVSSASLPFPVGVGDTWTYKTTYGKTVNTMTAVTPVSGGQQVTMSGTITSLGTTSNNTAYYVVHSDGSISLPFSQFSSTTASSGTSVKLISGSIFWPPAAQLASGQASHDTLRIEFIQGGKTQKVTAHVTVQGAGTQSVTVPAGTYSATVVKMTMSETVLGISVSSEVRTWLATGVGPVQTEVIINEGGTGHVLDENQLVSYKAG